MLDLCLRVDAHHQLGIHAWNLGGFLDSLRVGGGWVRDVTRTPFCCGMFPSLLCLPGSGQDPTQGAGR